MPVLSQSNEWGLIISSVADGTRPASPFGTIVTPGTNSYGSYVSLISGASVTADIFEIWINIESVAVSGAAHDSLVTIGVDPAGGSSFTDLISDLLGGCAGSYASGTAGAGGVWYRFPLKIQAGTSVGAKGSRSNGTQGFGVHCVLFGKPTRPELVRAGSFVRTFGSNPSGSNGTSITPGTTSEGAYVDLGTLADTLWFWEVGIGVGNSATNTNTYHVDVAIGNASNKKTVINNLPFRTSTSEDITKGPGAGGYLTGINGDHVYARAQVGPNGVVGGVTVAAYGVGG